MTDNRTTELRRMLDERGVDCVDCKHRWTRFCVLNDEYVLDSDFCSHGEEKQ